MNCKKCPESNDSNGCPCWTEIIMTNAEGDVKSVKNCLFQQLPMLMVEVIKASNRPAAEIGAMRGEMDTQMAKVASGIRQVPQMLADLMVQHPSVENQRVVIENHTRGSL